MTIPYYPLADAMIEAIARLQLGAIARRLRVGHEAELVIDDGVARPHQGRCTEIESGGRMIDAILTNTLLPELSRNLLSRRIAGLPLSKVMVGASPDGFTYVLE